MRILTFDVEEWFHILDHESTSTECDWDSYQPRIRGNVDRLLELLGQKKLSATFFVLGWIARRYPDVVRKISESGHEIGCHSDMHQLIYGMSPAYFKEDLRRGIETIEDAIGKRVVSYRAPGFSVTKGCDWFFEAIIEQGIEVDSSIFPAWRAHGGYPEFGATTPALVKTPSGVVRELPINTKRVFGHNIIFSGGGYFRVIPMPLLRRWLRDSDYVMTYFHPRDFDPDQPVIRDLPLLRKFKSYFGLRGALDKLSTILDEYCYIDQQAAVAAIDWGQARVIHLPAAPAGTVGAVSSARSVS